MIQGISNDDAQSLFSEYTNGSLAARNDLIIGYTPFVNSIASSFHRRFPPQVIRDDLEGDGIVGLIRGIEKYDSSMGLPRPYLRTKISGGILDGLRVLDHLTRLERRRVTKFTKVRDSYFNRFGDFPTDFQLQEVLAVDDAEYSRLRLAAGQEVLFLDQYNDPNFDPSTSLIIDACSGRFEELSDAKEVVTPLLDSLSSPNQRKVFVDHYFHGIPITRIKIRKLDSEEYLCPSRVCQLHKRGLEKLRREGAKIGRLA